MSGTDTPKLPLELERKVIEPLLCQVLALTTLARNYGVLEALKHRPASLRSVRHLLLYASRYDLYAPLLKDLVAACPGIVNLSMRIADPAPFLPLLDTMYIQRLSVNLSALFDHTSLEITTADLQHSLFTFVTHLDVLDEGYEPKWLPALTALPALTHLRFNYRVLPHLLRQSLPAHTRIRVLLFALEVDPEDAMEFAQEIDFMAPTLVVAAYEDYYADWEQGARGGIDLWVQAENFLERKRRGEIKKNQYFLTNTDVGETTY
ncbi:hypothetical protein B0H14DRAFT_2756396 [Mycena olivaceomarginata]|nr:hypothetical protein B0H14DRAFT_2756396 [Mycena olivaceomarginata]